MSRRAYYPPRFICGAEAHYGGLSAARKYSRVDLGRMGACNRAVKAEGARCFQHRTPEPSEPHACESCPTCGMHDGRHAKCCGCYDGVCCKSTEGSKP